MGHSTSDTAKVDPNHQTFTVRINHLKVKHPDYVDLKAEFRDKFCENVWDQILWALDDSVESYKHHGSYLSWKSAYNAIHTLKTITWVFGFIPICITLASFLITLFLLFISICLIVVGIRNSFYLWHGTYNMLTLTHKYILGVSYLITLVAVLILYFTGKSLKPLQDTYAQNMGKYISSNLLTLSKLYNTACFEMKWIKPNRHSLDCACGEGGIELVASIKISIFSETVEAIEDSVVMDTFVGNAESAQSREDDEFFGYRYGNSANSYCRVNTEGEPDIETDVSIEIIVEE
eukprot:659285_1